MPPGPLHPHREESHLEDLASAARQPLQVAAHPRHVADLSERLRLAVEQAQRRPAGVVADFSRDNVGLAVLLLGEERHHDDRLLARELGVHHRRLERQDGTDVTAHARRIVRQQLGLDHLAVAEDTDRRHPQRFAAAGATAAGSTFITSSCGRGIRCAETSSPVLLAAVAPASMAALTAPTSPRTATVTYPPPIDSRPKISTLAAFTIASAASIAATRPRVSISPSAPSMS